MTITFKIESELGFYNHLELSKNCPYVDDGRMIGSLKCQYCEYNAHTDYDSLTVDCSYEYEHLTEEEKKSI